MNIGSYELKNPILLAPLAGYSDYPYRTICYENGCELTYSEMVSSEGLVRGVDKTFRYLYQGESPSDNHSTAMQIFGSDPDVMADAAVIVQDEGADIVDINMGCPVKKVVRSNAGSAILGDLPRLKQIVSKVRKKVNIPLTVKIRSGWKNDKNAVEVALILEDLGVDAIILHPRTQKQMFSGKADWSLIKKVKEVTKIPIIGNGDVITYEDYQAIVNQTNCDAVMIGRGAIGNPWVFQYHLKNNYKPSISELKETIFKHYQLSIQFYGEREAIKLMRKHVSEYTKGLKNCSAFRGELVKLNQYEDVFSAINNFFSSF